MGAPGRGASIPARRSSRPRCASCTRSWAYSRRPTTSWGTLDDYPTRSGYLIAPVVVWAPGVTLTPNPGEVAGAYRIACNELFRDGSPEIVAIEESDRPIIRLPLPVATVNSVPVSRGRPRRPRHARRPLRTAGLRLALGPQGGGAPLQEHRRLLFHYLLAALVDRHLADPDDAPVGPGGRGPHSTMSVTTCSVSPGRTGRGNWTSPMPGEPRQQARKTPRSSHRRKVRLIVWRPEAIRPPNAHLAENSASMWKGCGSHWRRSR